VFHILRGNFSAPVNARLTTCAQKIQNPNQDLRKSKVASEIGGGRADHNAHSKQRFCIAQSPRLARPSIEIESRRQLDERQHRRTFDHSGEMALAAEIVGDEC
jgi:hypothetical protein